MTVITMEAVVGANIRRHRERLQMKRPAFAKAVGDALGVNPWTLPAVSHAENGNRAFTASEIAAVAKVLGVPPGAMLLIDRDNNDQDIDAVLVGKNPQPVARHDLQRLGASLDPESPMEYLKEIGRDVGTWRDQAGEIAEALRGLATTIATHAERAQGLSDRADDIESLATDARVQMLRYVQGSTPEIESPED